MRSLAAVATAELQDLLHRVRSGRLACPPQVFELRAAGQGRHAERIAAALAGLDPPAVEAVLETILAERSERPGPQIDLVWTGPEAKQAISRDTAVVVRELFAAATESVLIAGYRFDHGADLLEPLYQGMKTRGVHTQIFLDIERRRGDPESPHDCAQLFADRFYHRQWPWGSPRPDLYYDPRTAAARSVHSLHAKCVVVDGQRALIGSANFTDRGQTRNIEAGALIADRRFATRLVEHFHGLVHAGHFLLARSA